MLALGLAAFVWHVDWAEWLARRKLAQRASHLETRYTERKLEVVKELRVSSVNSAKVRVEGCQRQPKAC